MRRTDGCADSENASSWLTSNDVIGIRTLPGVATEMDDDDGVLADLRESAGDATASVAEAAAAANCGGLGK
jgi:hypothetical protein